MNVYCGGDKGAMKSMIETIQRGEEEDEELLERFGKMRAYLEKRDEQAGDWVFEVGLVPLFFFLLSHILLLPPCSFFTLLPHSRPLTFTPLPVDLLDHLMKD